MTQEQIKLNKQEQGRSMVEMLGVLTVIGVLSIGGVMGYDYAMDKNKANNIADGISKRAVILSSKAELGDGVDSDSLTAEFGSDDKIEGYSIGVEGYEESNGFDLTVEGLPKSLCKKLLDQGVSSASAIKLGTKLVWDKGEYDDSKATCAETGNNIVYEFNSLLDSSEGSGKGPGDIEDSGECSESGYHWCTAGDNASSCQEDCCAGVTTGKCLTCSAAGVVSYPGSETACNYTGTNDGQCNGSGECVANPCANFTATTCTTACTSNNGTADYTYVSAGSNTPCKTTPTAATNDGLCDGSGECITNPCANFTATTCTTACTSNNGTAQYTYVSAGSKTPCKTTATAATNDGICNGSGVCEAAAEEEEEETCLESRKYTFRNVEMCCPHDLNGDGGCANDDDGCDGYELGSDGQTCCDTDGSYENEDGDWIYDFSICGCPDDTYYYDGDCHTCQEGECSEDSDTFVAGAIGTWDDLNDNAGSITNHGCPTGYTWATQAQAEANLTAINNGTKCATCKEKPLLTSTVVDSGNAWYVLFDGSLHFTTRNYGYYALCVR